MLNRTVFSAASRRPAYILVLVGPSSYKPYLSQVHPDTL
eukprot:COSAG01_NODE_31647_length_593_cov_26.704453_1_plen_38_part_01